MKAEAGVALGGCIWCVSLTRIARTRQSSQASPRHQSKATWKLNLQPRFGVEFSGVDRGRWIVVGPVDRGRTSSDVYFTVLTKHSSGFSGVWSCFRPRNQAYTGNPQR